MKLQREDWMPLSSKNPRRILLCSSDDALAAVTLRAVSDGWTLAQETDPARVPARIAEFGPQAVFVDFHPDAGDIDKLIRATELVRRILQTTPGMPLVALGSQDQPKGPLAALRAGVHEFVDPFAEPGEVLNVAERVVQPGAGIERSVRRVALLGARPGVGCSTLAAHLSDLLRRRHACDPRGLVLCDLGWPAGDAQLYLGLKSSELDFAQAVHNVSRLDSTLVRTAFSASANGVVLVPLPTDLDDMQTVTQTGALGLLDTLMAHFGILVADLGGLPHPDFVAQVATHADQAWLVTDQSIGALVSLAHLLRELDAREVPRARLRLVVNRYGEDYGMSAEQIEARFGVPLLATIPDRTRALLAASSQGELLSATAEQDPYVRAVQAVIETTWRTASDESSALRWLQRLLPAELLRSGLGKGRPHS